MGKSAMKMVNTHLLKSTKKLAMPILILLVTFTSLPLHANDWVEKVKAFVKSNKKCQVALYSVFINEDHRKSALQRNIREVTCIADLTHSKGTVHEATGCALVWYNVETDNYRPFTELGGTDMAKGKACIKGGFEDLMKMTLWTSHDGSPVIVKDFITSSYSSMRTEIIYSEDKKYEDQLNKSIKKFELEKLVQKKKEKAEREAASVKKAKEVKAAEIMRQQQKKKKQEVEALYE